MTLIYDVWPHAYCHELIISGVYWKLHLDVHNCLSLQFIIMKQKQKYICDRYAHALCHVFV